MGQLEDLIARFSGDEGARRLFELLKGTELIRGADGVAEAFVSVAKPEAFAIGEAIVEQGAADNDFFFVLIGSVTIERNARPGPVRFAGAHFGEMAVVDSRVLRSATVRARENCVVARVSEPSFTKIANEHAELWRRLACEIAVRLRQRLEDIPQRNEKPIVFIGSSRERLDVATALRDALANRGVDAQLWSAGVFEASYTTIESLEEAARGADFGVLVLGADDEVVSRGEKSAAPRDNVVFELGLFMGALGRTRTFALIPPTKTKIPSDLFGVAPLKYDDSDPTAFSSSLDAACSELVAVVARLGPK